MPNYRGLRLVIQNSTPGALSVEAAEVLQGQWHSADGLTERGGCIAAQSAAALDCCSDQLQVGCEAFLRLASVVGIVHLDWEVPWVGQLRLRCELNEGRWAHDLIVLDESPAFPVALLTLSPPREPFEPTPVRRRRR